MKKSLCLLGVIAIIMIFSIAGCIEPFSDPDDNETSEDSDDNNTENDNGNDRGNDNKDDSEDDDRNDNDLITNVADVLNYLKKQEGGASKTDPVVLSVKFALGTMAGNSNWQKLLTAIAEADKYVELDLSACTVSADFDNASSFQTGKDKIVTLVLPDELKSGITYNGDSTGVFQHFINLESVTGKKVSAIGRYAFSGCDNLKNASFSMATVIDQYAFFDCTSLVKVDLPNAQHIAGFAFSNCTSLKEVIFENVTTVEPKAFEGCSGLESLNFPNIEILDPLAFKDCNGLVSVIFPMVEIIHASTFSNCTNLTNVSFPNARHIASSAFSNCKALNEVTFEKVTIVEPLAFEDCENLEIVKFLVNPTRTSTDHPLKPWSTGVEGLPCTDDCVLLHNDAFKGCTSLKTLDIRNAWNVYFVGNALANIGNTLDLYLFDDDGTISYGHPQLDTFLGPPPPAVVSLTINLIVPLNWQKINVKVEPSVQGSGIAAFIRTVYGATAVTVNGVALYN